MGTALAGVTIVGVSVLAALLGFAAVERICAREKWEQHNDVAGFIYAVLGVIYAVLVAYVVIVVWQDFAAAHLTTEQEANQVADLYNLADQLPTPYGARVQEFARAYARSVIERRMAAPGPRASESPDDGAGARARSRALGGRAADVTRPGDLREGPDAVPGTRGQPADCGYTRAGTACTALSGLILSRARSSPWRSPTCSASTTPARTP